MKKVEGIILKIVGWIMALLIFLMMADIFAAVLSRYVFRSSLSFAEELGRYIFVWITFLGMARCIASDKHVALDLISHALSGEAKKKWQIATYVISIVFFVALTYGGIMLVQVGMKQKSPTMRIPMNYLYIVIPICGILSIFFLINKIIDTCRKEEKEA